MEAGAARGQKMPKDGVAGRPFCRAPGNSRGIRPLRKLSASPAGVPRALHGVTLKPRWFLPRQAQRASHPPSGGKGARIPVTQKKRTLIYRAPSCLPHVPRFNAPIRSGKY